MRQPGAQLVPSNLKFRLTGVVVALVLTASLLVSLASMLLAERDMKAVVGAQQVAVLSSLAAFIDDRLAAKKQLLGALAEALPATARRAGVPPGPQPGVQPVIQPGIEPVTAPGIALGVQLHQYLASHASLRSDFDQLAVYAADGTLLAGPPAMAGRADGAQFFTATVAARRPIVSAPFRVGSSGQPVVLVTAPLFDEAGRLLLIFTGSVALHESAFMRQVDQIKPGGTGFAFLMTADGILIDHPERRRQLHHISERPGRNLATERALAGFEGTIEADNKDGAPCIYTYRRLREANWIIGARYPVAEAFAPLFAMRGEALAAAVLVACLAGGLAWLLIYRLLAPLEALRLKVAAVRQRGADIGILQSGRSDEIGELADTFHELVAAREADQARLRASEKRACVIADNMPALIGYINHQERYEFANAHYRTLLGVDPAKMIGSTVREVLGADNYARIAPRMQAALAGQRQHFDQQFAGAGRHYMIDYIPETGDDGRNPGVYVLARDISERRSAEMQKEESERRLKLITDHLPVLISYIDRDHIYRFGNATFASWLGVNAATLAGRPMVEVWGEQVYADARVHLENAFGGWPVTFESRVAAGGSTRVLETTYVPDVQADGKVAGVYGLTHDTTRLKETEEQLSRMARVDSLTGIANRRRFVEALPQALERSRRHGAALALAYLDIDSFKKINDTHGHAVGDDVLKEFAQRLQACVRSTDLVARLSGDEFVVIIDDAAGVDDCRLLAEKIVAAIRQPFLLGALQLAVTTSVGVACYDGAGTDEQLLANADSALYQSKRAGRDGVTVYAPPSRSGKAISPALG